MKFTPKVDKSCLRGRVVRPIIFETLILIYEMKGKARTRPDFFRVVLGPCAQFYTCEASEKKLGQTPKSKPKNFEPILATIFGGLNQKSGSIRISGI